MPGPSLRRILVALAILAPCWAGTSLAELASQRPGIECRGSQSGSYRYLSKPNFALGPPLLTRHLRPSSWDVVPSKANATVTPLLLLTDVCLVQVEHLKQQSKEGEAVLSKLHTHS
ncbi:hypothetical protein PCANC_24799 [Puccinia coronata f. sp. avenae]|uniref:Uncharacterized protein n=1 Tax=Puccinia coronata f. sp. avenae TaxID=200324 RepID=A0A2N5TQA9_9BASI|nr:hypothetical protein PCANC_24799 [Puccinia coronata f. sp. avenae]